MLIFFYNLAVIIDCHTHIFPPEIKRNRSSFISRDPCFAELYGNPASRLVTAPELVESMDKAEIDISLLLNISWQDHELCRLTNDYILESVARSNGRLIGFCAVPPRLTDVSLAEIERCARGGAKGIGEMRLIVKEPESETVLAPFLEVMQKNNLILLTHASEPLGHDYPGKGKLTPEALYRLIKRLPGLTVICAHFGGGLPFYALMPEVKAVLGQVYFDCAASPYLYSPQVFRHVIELVSETKVLFGSDFPVITQGRVLKDINSLGLDSGVKDLVLAGNARRLFGIGRETATPIPH